MNKKILKNSFKSRNHYLEALKILNKIKKPVKILEVGAADCKIKEFLNKNIKYTSIDLKQGSDYNTDLNKEKLPFKDNTFDAIMCLETLEHTLYPHKAMQELKRVTKPKGLMILSMPNEYNYWLRINYVLGIKKMQTDTPFLVVEKLQHIHKPRAKDVINFFKQHTEIKKIVYIWQSKASGTKNIFTYIDKPINLLAKIYPSLFSRVVMVFAKNKK